MLKMSPIRAGEMYNFIFFEDWKNDTFLDKDYREAKTRPNHPYMRFFWNCRVYVRFYANWIFNVKK